MRWSFILPAQWNNSLPLVKSLHSVTSAVFAFLLNAACSAESSLQIYTIYHLEASMWTITSLMWPLTNLLKTNAVIFYSQVHSFTWNKLWEFTFLCHFFFSLISILHLYQLLTSFSSCFEASTNKLYISRQCIYIVFILQYCVFTNFLNLQTKRQKKNIWVSTTLSLLSQRLLHFVLH